MNTKTVYYIRNFLWKLIEFHYTNEETDNYNLFMPSQRYSCISPSRISE